VEGTEMRCTFERVSCRESATSYDLSSSQHGGGVAGGHGGDSLARPDRCGGYPFIVDRELPPNVRKILYVIRSASSSRDRSAIGHMKEQSRLGRCYLKGFAGDAANAILSAIGYNFRRVLARFRKFLLSIIRALLADPKRGSARVSEFHHAQLGPDEPNALTFKVHKQRHSRCKRLH